MVKNKTKQAKKSWRPSKRLWLLAAGVLVTGLVVGVYLVSQSRAQEIKEAPEAQRILELQASMPFQILIPAYLPKGFDRPNVEIHVDQAGPGGEPMTLLTYRHKSGATLFIKEWVPVNPGMEILASSRPIETKWGKGWLLRQGTSLRAIWVDIGPLRISVYSGNLDVLPEEQLLAIAENLGPPSNDQVFYFSVDTPGVKDMPPPAPYEVPVNADGVQELTLVITPGGYDPLRFAVKKGVPVKLTFKMLGQVGCGSVLVFPSDPQNPVALALASPDDKQVLEFTPQKAGEFQFYCAHQMYRGVLTVRE